MEKILDISENVEIMKIEALYNQIMIFVKSDMKKVRFLCCNNLSNKVHNFKFI